MKQYGFVLEDALAGSTLPTHVSALIIPVS